MAYYKVQVRIMGDQWVYPDDDWDYTFESVQAAQACAERVRQIPEFQDLDVRVYEAGRYDAIVYLIFEGVPVIQHSELFDTVERGREGVARLRKRYAAPDYDVWLYDTVDDVTLEVQ